MFSESVACAFDSGDEGVGGVVGRGRASGDGPRLRGRRDPSPCRGDGDDAGRAAEGEQECRTGNLQASERNLTAVPKTQGLPAHLHAVRQA